MREKCAFLIAKNHGLWRAALLKALMFCFFLIPFCLHLSRASLYSFKWAGSHYASSIPLFWEGQVDCFVFLGSCELLDKKSIYHKKEINAEVRESNPKIIVRERERERGREKEGLPLQNFSARPHLQLTHQQNATQVKSNSQPQSRLQTSEQTEWLWF